MPPLSTKPCRSNPALGSPQPSSGSLGLGPPDLPPLSTKPKRPVSSGGSEFALGDDVEKTPAVEETKQTVVGEEVALVKAEDPPTEPQTESAPAFDAIDFDAAFSAEIDAPSTQTAPTKTVSKRASTPFDLSEAFGPSATANSTTSAQIDPFSADFTSFGTTLASTAVVSGFDFDEAFGGPVATTTSDKPVSPSAFSFEEAFGGSDPFAVRDVLPSAAAESKAEVVEDVATEVKDDVPASAPETKEDVGVVVDPAESLKEEEKVEVEEVEAAESEVNVEVEAGKGEVVSEPTESTAQLEVVDA
ncbi:hypothetical protein HDU67_005088, partial [Dinochytrium kinnereticum]